MRAARHQVTIAIMREGVAEQKEFDITREQIPCNRSARTNSATDSRTESYASPRSRARRLEVQLEKVDKPA